MWPSGYNYKIVGQKKNISSFHGGESMVMTRTLPIFSCSQSMRVILQISGGLIEVLYYKNVSPRIGERTHPPSRPNAGYIAADHQKLLLPKS